MKQIVEQYMKAYNELDDKKILSLLTDDVEWIVPGAFHIKGKAAVGKEIRDHEYDAPPRITVTRLTEENNVVIAEGTVIAQHKGQEAVHLVFCDVFEFDHGKIKKLISYLGTE